MSEQLEAIDEAPRRARPTRADAQEGHRRRRNAGSLNRMVQFKLDFIPPEQLDLDNYVYYWANDEGANIRQMTLADDYDFVSTHELGDGFDAYRDTDSESEDRVRVLTGTQKSGAPLFSYLLKKRRAFWEADYEDTVRAREDMMAGRVYRAEADQDERQPEDADKFYATPGNTIGHAAQRRRGPVPRTL